MEENFELLFSRVMDTLVKSNLNDIKNILSTMKGNTVVVGAGGSFVPATFASKVLNINNVRSSRDLNYMDLSNIDNILIVSYSGKGLVIENLLNKGKNIYILTNGEEIYDNVNYIKYNSSIKKEKSFISIASTLMPVAILYQYYTGISLDEFEKRLSEISKQALSDDIFLSDIYEIITGYDSLTASIFLKSTMVESGIAIPVIHDKYDYCHGRTTLSYNYHSSLIYFDSGKELDKLLLDNLRYYYDIVIKVDQYYQKDDIIGNDFAALIKSMYICKNIALKKKIDLSKINYSPLVKKLYYYKGDM